MKIACVDNMNNMMFALTRYLRDLGYDTDLIVNRNYFSHFDPSADTYNDSYKDYTIYYDNVFQRSSNRTLQKQYGKYDVIIGSSYAPYICERLGRNLDVFVPHGSDLFSYPFAKLSLNPKSIYLKHIAYTQKKGIENSNVIHMDYTNSQLEAIWDHFNIKGKREIQPLPFIYNPQYSTDEAIDFKKKSSICTLLERVKNENDLIVMQHSRQQWTCPQDSFYQKGNDKLINGFAEFVKSNPNYKAKLVLLEYGLDIDASKKLIKDLAIEEHVVWFPQSRRNELMLALDYADIGVGGIGHSWFSYCSIFEYMSKGIPVVHHRNDSLYTNYYPEQYPMSNAQTSDDILNILESYKKDSSSFKIMGKKAKEWYDKFVIQRPLEMYSKYLSGRNV